MHTKRVPITIITGFLGAGKTTFLNYVLNEYHGKRIVVIQNNFGDEVKLEQAMVVGADGQKAEEWLELPNGCVCCSVRGDLALTLENLIKRKDRFDYILLETTGIADPGPLATSLWVDDELGSSIYLDAIVTIVDSKYFGKSLEMTTEDGTNEAQKQVAFADVILLNKMDLIEVEEVEILREKVKKVNSIAPLIQTTKSVVPLNQILDIRSFDMNQKNQLNEVLELKGDEGHHHCGEHCETHGAASHSVTTICITTEGETTSERLTQWFAQIYWEKMIDCEIMRMKGVANIQDSNEKHMIQGVHDTFDIQPSSIDWEQNEKRINKIVFIGKRLNSENLLKSFRELALVKH